jgi:hypothetical protein
MLLLFFLNLFDALIGLHAMNEKKCSNECVILYVIFSYLNYDLYFVIVVEAFITLKSLV